MYFVHFFFSNLSLVVSNAFQICPILFPSQMMHENKKILTFFFGKMNRHIVKIKGLCWEQKSLMAMYLFIVFGPLCIICCKGYFSASSISLENFNCKLNVKLYVSSLFRFNFSCIFFHCVLAV